MAIYKGENSEDGSEERGNTFQNLEVLAKRRGKCSNERSRGDEENIRRALCLLESLQEPSSSLGSASI
jgi:hypothetical protein